MDIIIRLNVKKICDKTLHKLLINCSSLFPHTHTHNQVSKREYNKSLDD